MKVVDMHCDTIAALYENKEKGWTLQDNGLHIRLDKMKQGDYLLQNFALFVCTENCEDPYQQALALARGAGKQARTAARREQEQADRERRFALRVQRRKEKHRGR